MRTAIAGFVAATLVLACASKDKLFSVRGELAWAQMPPTVEECGTGTTWDIVMVSSLYHDFARRADELAAASSDPIIVELRGPATLDLTDALLRRSLETRFKMRVRHVDLIEHGSCN